MATLAALPRQAEWEALVSAYQRTYPDSPAGEKWRVLKRIYQMDQTRESTPEEGYPQDSV
jgi:L-rhamnose mutarotase